MGNCLSSFASLLCPNSANSSSGGVLNVLVLGLDGAGKTELVHQLAHTDRIDYAPTVGCKSDLVVIDAVRLRLTELGGAKDVRGIWSHYYQDAHGAIFLIDSTDHRRLLLARTLLTSIVLHSKLSGKPMLVVCTKQDRRPAAIDYLQCCAFLDLEHLANLARTPCYVAMFGHAERDELDAGVRWLVGCVQRDWRRIRNQNEFFSATDGGDGGDGGDAERRPRLQSSRSLVGERRVRRQPVAEVPTVVAVAAVKRPSTAPSRERIRGVSVAATVAPRSRNRQRVAPSAPS